MKLAYKYRFFISLSLSLVLPPIAAIYPPRSLAMVKRVRESADPLLYCLARACISAIYPLLVNEVAPRTTSVYTPARHRSSPNVVVSFPLLSFCFFLSFFLEPAAIANLAPGIIAIYSGAQLGAAHLSCILEGELGLPRAFYRLAERGIAKRLRVDSFFFSTVQG